MKKKKKNDFLVQLLSLSIFLNFFNCVNIVLKYIEALQIQIMDRGS